MPSRPSALAAMMTTTMAIVLALGLPQRALGLQWARPIGLGSRRIDHARSAMTMSDTGPLAYLASLFGDESTTDEPSPELEELVEFLTRDAGFVFRMTLGSEPARMAGGTGQLAQGSSATVGIELPCRFRVDDTPGFDPLQGDVEVLKKSKYLTTPPCFWIADCDTGETLPSLWQMRVRCTGVSVGGDELIPDGLIFLDARIGKKRLGGYELLDGKVTVKEDVKFSRGILAELKTVGTFTVSLREADDRDESSAGR